MAEYVFKGIFLGSMFVSALYPLHFSFNDRVNVDKVSNTLQHLMKLADGLYTINF